MNTLGKILFSAALALTLAGASSAQEKKYSAHIRVGTGLFTETGSMSPYDPGMASRLSAGVERTLGSGWSAMIGGGIRSQLADIAHFGWTGGDPDGLSLADVYFIGRYSLPAGRSTAVFGLGPQVSFVTSNDTYYIDADPNDPVAGKTKFRKADIGIQPSAYLEFGKHWEVGIEGCIGLRNMMIQYPEYGRTGSIRMQTFIVNVGFRF
ncbi:MAG: hypothetical protein IJ202_10605 [Bacteroidales bacterium]|nr:hypothetical protein [Bacteroidales bacterium]MBQ9711255.1 hypothetical protein [Bacteroidales bacterium]